VNVPLFVKIPPSSIDKVFEEPFKVLSSSIVILETVAF